MSEPSTTGVDPDKAQGVLDALRIGGRISDASYHKALVIVAYEFVLRGSMSEAKSVLRRCPRSYFSDVMPEQMRVDAVFRVVALATARAFTNDVVNRVQLDHRGPVATA